MYEAFMKLSNTVSLHPHLDLLYHIHKADSDGCVFIFFFVLFVFSLFSEPLIDPRGP